MFEQKSYRQRCIEFFDRKLKKLEFDFDLIVSILATVLFFICIISISSFQSLANKFYNRFFDSNINQTESSEYYTAGSDLVKQTGLFCNGPYFSYQINNLIVLPFSLLLVIVFCFFNKNRRFCIPGVPVVVNPFRRKNRFFIAALYCILANEIFKMIESSIFDSSNSETHNRTIEFISSFNSNKTLNQSNADFLKIGLGIEPEVVQRRTKIFKTTKKTTRPFFSGPLVLRYSKPKLRPKLNLNDVQTTHKAEMLFIDRNHGNLQVSLNVDAGVQK